jgi:hypothetical protein
MHGPGDPADPDPGGVTPPAAFFGLWPKFAGAGDDLAASERRIVEIPFARRSPACNGKWERMA